MRSHGDPVLMRPMPPAGASILVLGALASLLAASPAHAQAVPETTFVWTSLDDQTSSFAGNRSCSIFDVRRFRTTVFGGGYATLYTGGAFYTHRSGLMVLQSRSLTWTHLTTSGDEPLVQDAAAAYDSVSDAVWLFGGWHFENVYVSRSDFRAVFSDKLARLDLASRTWTTLPTSGAAPTARFGASLIHDPIRRRLVLFGGRDSLQTEYADLWTMDLANPSQWTHVADAGPA